jgi:hypothetical protein
VPRDKGTPEKLNAAVQKEICDSLELALPEKCAAEAAGVDEMTFHSWMRKGADGTEPYKSFHDAVMRSCAKAIKNLTLRALRGEKGSREALFFLERRFRQYYGSHVMIGGVPEGERTQLQHDLKIAEKIRSTPGAVKKLHAVLLEVIEESSGRRPQPKP